MNTDFGLEKIIFVISGLVIFLISASVHEFAHAFSAYKLGDNTAKNMGRLTLNPLSHIDVFGSILFPLIGSLSGLPVIGWMKPVPINPMSFKNQSKGSAITSFAGPFSNFFQASFGLIIFKIFKIFITNFEISNNISASISDFIMYFCLINLALMIFNLIPVPPLDGGWILRHFLPEKLKPKFDIVYPFVMIILFIVIFTGVFKYIFMPFQLFLIFISAHIYEINIGIISIPFVLCLILVLFFLKDDLNKLASRILKKDLTTPVQTNKIENLQQTSLADQANLIITKLEKKFKLDESDLNIINKIEAFCLEVKVLCDPIDFEIKDTHCINCDNYICCMLRKIKMIKEEHVLI